MVWLRKPPQRRWIDRVAAGLTALRGSGERPLSRKRGLNRAKNIVRDSLVETADVSPHGNDPAKLLRTRACDAVGCAFGGLRRQPGLARPLVLANRQLKMPRFCKDLAAETDAPVERRVDAGPLAPMMQQAKAQVCSLFLADRQEAHVMMEA